MIINLEEDEKEDAAVTTYVYLSSTAVTKTIQSARLDFPLSLIVLQHDLYFRKLIFLNFRCCNAMSQN